MLKADMHLHADEDTSENLSYTAKELIDKAAKEGYDVLSFTFHNQYFFPHDIVEYAKEKGILLISGIEKNFGMKHVLLYNFTEDELKEINTLDDLREKKKSHHLVIAPHPFYPTKTAIKNILKTYVDIFDGVEHAYLYLGLPFLNPNKKAKTFAKAHHLTLMANTDLHFIDNFGMQYSEIDAPQEKQAIITAIKEGKVTFKTRTPSLFHFAKDMFRHVLK